MGTSVGNPPGAEVTDVKLGAVGTVDDGPQVTQKFAGGITLDEAWVVLKEIGLRESSGCSAKDDDDGYHHDDDYENAYGDGSDLPGVFAANLITSTIHPAAPSWRRAANEKYCGLRVSLAPGEDPVAGAPDALAGHGIYVRGKRADGTPFEIRTDIEDHLSVRGASKGDFELGVGEVGLLLTFNLNGWINPGAFDKAEVKNGLIIADDDTNKDLTESLKSRIPQSARLVNDQDRNGKLDSDDEEL